MSKSLETAQKALAGATPAAQADPLRPRYHFAPPAQWMNDPNGTIFINGDYHLFYQLNPYAAHWGEIHWGHAKSPNLAHWEHLPIALTPAYDLNEHHCFSGCCVNDNGTPTIFYTSIGGLLGLANAWRGAQQWKASGDAALTTWQRASDNPFISQALHQRKIYDWRDPYIWRDGPEWRMVLAGKHFGELGGSVYMYASPDLKTWAFNGAIYKSEKGVECPNMLKFGERYALVISPYGPVRYAIGTLEGGQFRAEKWLSLDHGKDFYATNTFIDSDEGYKLVGWLKVPGNGAWHGCLSLPRHITLDAGRLRIMPAAGLQSLRKEAITLPQADSVTGNCLEIRATFAADASTTPGLHLRDDEHDYPLTVDFPSGELHVFNQKYKLEQFNASEELKLHIFIDHSVIEIFINDRESVSTWHRPTLARSGAWQVSLAAPALSVEAWEMTG